MILVFGLTGRSGTTSVMLALKDTIGKKYISEPFNTEAPMKGIKFPVIFETLASDMRAFDYGVLKMLHYQLETVEKNMELIRQFDKVVLMYRRNITDYTLSEHVSGSYKELTGDAVYHSYDFEAPQISIVPDRFYTEVRTPLPLESIEENYKYYNEAKERYLCCFQKERIDYTTVVYEEMFTQNVQQDYFALCDFLNIERNDRGLKWLAQDQRLNRETEFEKLIPNYDEVLKIRDKFVL